MKGVTAGYAVLGVVMWVVGCSDSVRVGQACEVFLDPGSPAGVVVERDPDCPGGLCLSVALDPGRPSLCSATCSADVDCVSATDSSCTTGFTCAVAVVLGPECCQPMCICKDDVIIPDGGIPRPSACDPDGATNMCCNLAGRPACALSAAAPSGQ